MENLTGIKHTDGVAYRRIDGIFYRPDWTRTFLSIPVGGEMKFSRLQLTITVARSSIRWVTNHYPGTRFSVTACDRLQDHFIVKRLS